MDFVQWRSPRSLFFPTIILPQPPKLCIHFKGRENKWVLLTMAGWKMLPVTTETNSFPKPFQRELKKELNSPGAQKVWGVLVQCSFRFTEVLEERCFCKSAPDEMFHMSMWHFSRLVWEWMEKTSLKTSAACLNGSNPKQWDFFSVPAAEPVVSHQQVAPPTAIDTRWLVQSHSDQHWHEYKFWY